MIDALPHAGLVERERGRAPRGSVASTGSVGLRVTMDGSSNMTATATHRMREGGAGQGMRPRPRDKGHGSLPSLPVRPVLLLFESMS